MTIQQQIEALKKDFETKIAELEKQLAEEKQSKAWKPKNSEPYWYVCDIGVLKIVGSMLMMIRKGIFVITYSKPKKKPSGQTNTEL